MQLIVLVPEFVCPLDEYRVVVGSEMVRFCRSVKLFKDKIMFL